MEKLWQALRDKNYRQYNMYHGQVVCDDTQLHSSSCDKLFSRGKRLSSPCNYNSYDYYGYYYSRHYGCTNKCAYMHIYISEYVTLPRAFFFSENIEGKHFSTWGTIWHALLNIGNVHDRVAISQVVLTKPPIYSVEFRHPHMGIPSVQLILLLYKIEVLI